MKWLREALGIVAVVLMVAMVAVHYHQLPEVIATHFDAHGAANGWSGKMVLLLLAAVGCVSYAMLTAAQRMPEHMVSLPIKLARKPNAMPLAVEMVAWLKVEVAWVFAYICHSIIRVGLGKQEGLSVWFLPVMVGVLLATTGTYYVKISRSED